MYQFPVYWTDKLKADFLQRVILIHSYRYYELDSPTWSDRQYDNVSRQLLDILTKHTKDWIITQTQYGYAFDDYDGNTGFDLWHRLSLKDKQFIDKLARANIW